MYRFLLLTGDEEIAARVTGLLGERARGRFLLRVATWPLKEMPLVNDRPADVVLGELPRAATQVERYMAGVLRVTGATPFIALSPREDEEAEVRAVQAGAQDCLVLMELTSRSLLRAVRYGIERANIERRLARERQMLASLMDQLPDRIYFKDLRSRFIRINRAMAKLFRLRDPEMAVGRTDHDYFTTEHAQPALEDEREVIRTGQSILNKLEKETLPSGEVSWVLTSKLPLRSEAGAITGTFGISHDVTQMKLLEDAVDAERLRFKELSEDLHAKNLQLEQDLSMAKGIQEALLPEKRVVFPEEGGASARRIVISSVYRPASAVGGDFFTVLPISERKVGILICDIMGHGLRAALGTAILRGLIEQSREVAASPAEFLTSLNAGLRAILRNIDEPLLVTAFYLVADVETGALIFGSAGHPGPVMADRKTGTVRQMELDRALRGPALALFDDAVFGEDRLVLGPHGIVVLFTDGAIEMTDTRGGVIGIEQFVKSTKRHVKLEADQLCAKLISDIQQTAGRMEFEDDVCLVTLERQG